MAALTREAIRSVLGPVDDTLAAALVRTGANEGELREAHLWVLDNQVLVDDMRPLPSGRTGDLIEILQTQDEWLNDEG